MASYGNSSNRISRDQLRVTDAQQPGWLSATDRMPAVGELVQCAEGLAQVVRIAGRTGDGSRLLELSLPDRPRQPFFAAASNVLVAPSVSAA
ncbi:hypothetical protein BH23GEM9_BH23GEM9_17580 [soil metagenome]